MTILTNLHPQPCDQIQDRPLRLADEADDLCADLQEEHHDADHDERDPVRFIHRRRGLDDCQDAEECGDTVHDQHRLAVAEADFAKAVMQVALVRCEDRFLLHPTADDRKERIRQRHADDDQRGDKRDDRDLLESKQGEHRQTEAQEQRSRIPHENLGRVEIEVQKSDDGAEKQETQHGNHHVAHQQGHHEDGADRDAGYAGRQAVETVDEVNGVRYADNPNDGQRNGNPVFQRRIVISKRNIYKVHFNIESEHDHARSNDLAEQLHLGRQLEAVVERADQHDQRSAQQECLNKVGIPHREMIGDKRKDCEHG